MNNRVKTSWSNGKQVKNSQTTRVNRSYTLWFHHRIPLLCYASLWLWAVAVQASRHYNSQHYPEFLCPAPQRHQSQNMKPTITPYCKTSLRNSHDLEQQKRALYTKPCAREEVRASQTPTAPFLSFTGIWPFTSLRYCVLYMSIHESIKQTQGALFTMGVVFVRPACGGSIDLLVCRWSICCAVMVPELPGRVWLWAVWSVPMLCQEQYEHNTRLWTCSRAEGCFGEWWNTQTQCSSFCSHKHVVYRSRLTVLLQYLSEIGSRYCV